MLNIRFKSHGGELNNQVILLLILKINFMSLNLLNPEQVGKLISLKTIVQNQTFDFLIAVAVTGMNLLNLSLGDIQWTVFEKDNDKLKSLLGTFDPKSNLNNLMDMGMGLYPAYVLVHLDQQEQKNINFEVITNGSIERTPKGSVEAIFVAFLYLFITGSLPVNNDYVPKFISDVYLPGYKPHEEIKKYYMCNLGKLDHKWIKNFPFKDLPEKIKNRLSLSMAGYRYLVAIAYITFKAGTPDTIITLQEKIRKYIESGMYWDMHPLFRSSKNITKYGSMNRSFEGILAKYGETSDIIMLVNIKALNHTPEPRRIDPKIFAFDATDFSSDPVDFGQETSPNILSILKELTS